MGELGLFVLYSAIGLGVFGAGVGGVWLGWTYIRKRVDTNDLRLIVDDLGGRIEELEERADFQERLLNRYRQAERLESGTPEQGSGSER